MNSKETASLSHLLSMIKNGTEQDEAFAELVRRYTPLINNRVVAFFPGSDDISEPIQEAHIALHSAAVTYDSDKCEGVTFGLYASVCISNRIKSFIRSRHRRVRHEDESLDSDRLLTFVDVDEALAGREMLTRVMKIAKDCLSDFEYRVFVLQLEGYPTRDIARKLSRDAKSVDNAKARLSRSLRKNSEISRLFLDML